jgi:hypothetical protein
LKEVKSPWAVRYYLERFERGKWNTEYLDRKVPDFCAELQNPSMPWYCISSLFGKKDCPYPAGHVETLKDGEMGSLPKDLAFSYAGKYRLVFESTFIEGLKKWTECSFVNIEILEI